MTVGPKFPDINGQVNSGGEDFGTRIKRALALDLKECPRSRGEVAFEISKRAGRVITEAQIDSYTAITKQHRIPIELVPLWVQVTGSRRLLDLICEEAGFFVATGVERDLAEMGRIHLEREQSERRLAEIKGKLCRGL